MVRPGVGVLLLQMLIAHGHLTGGVDQCPKDVVHYDLIELDCPDETVQMLVQPEVPWNTPFRAFMTFPRELELRQSIIPRGGYGVFATTFIPRWTCLGEYEGEIADVDKRKMSDYVFGITRGWRPEVNLDAESYETSNWARWVNCARHPREQNIQFLECATRVFFLTTKDVWPGTELLTYYGEEYAQLLGIKVSPTEQKLFL